VKARGEQIPIPILAAAMSGVLHGLHSAHEARTEHGEPLDIVHRDISPQNIIVGRDGSTRVFDFGVAKAVGRLQTTREGQIKGKLGYMAPELFHGARPTREVDIYGAAVVLWEGITGTRLFAGGHEADVVGRILRGAVPTPAREGETIAPGLAALVKRGLDLDPSRRFPTARDMAFALEAEVPLAIPSTVGTWVEAVAADVLHQRAARVAEIEIHSSPLPDDAPVFELPSEVSLRVTEGLPTQTTSISVTTGQPEPALRKRRATTAIVGGLVLVATASGAMYLGLRRPSPVTTDTVPATSAPAVASVAPIEAIEAAAAPQASSASAPSAPPPTPTPVAQATTSAPATAGPNTKATPAPHSSAPRRPSRHNGLFVE
jgi:serine/threonine-protein kinase